ncbi:protoporphyrinogen oxidase HemJ [Marinibactrum halimedae]|uniref:Protoporphyrinogen IX oxidase n=1 Tax=Marinibactrum halimedae TaxID=1444977 RepID=A0AA37T5T4_9GAMM|nr:protoporphyrinogen oxidase HemJ [Marinibactrum halimedae]MCD9460515.1 protoporphyrinogen oxidase HemJ [Marinibactrum halimedae]GLS27878.1 membrane protein [Marinibactrum halimedae]
MLWVKALHIVSMVSWFAVLFYLPRLFVYHANTEDEAGKERFKIMEKKLYRGIGTPSIIATIIFGGWLVSASPSYYFSSGWFHAKLTLVVLLIGYHHMCGAMVKRFARDENTRSHVFYRWFNEVPVIFLLGIVILVVVKPF